MEWSFLEWLSFSYPVILFSLWFRDNSSLYCNFFFKSYNPDLLRMTCDLFASWFCSTALPRLLRLHLDLLHHRAPPPVLHQRKHHPLLATNRRDIRPPLHPLPSTSLAHSRNTSKVFFNNTILLGSSEGMGWGNFERSTLNGRLMKYRSSQSVSDLWQNVVFVFKIYRLTRLTLLKIIKC